MNQGLAMEQKAHLREQGTFLRRLDMIIAVMLSPSIVYMEACPWLEICCSKVVV